jgi:glutaconate CoA-transferase subunit A
MLGSDLVGLVDTHELICPFTGETVLLVPALNPDVALVHVHRADRYGNAQIDGYTHMDADMVAAARTVIVSTEEVVDAERIMEGADATVIPHFQVDAVVEAPMGAFPHELYGRYEADFAHFDEYVAAVRRDGLAAVSAYLDRHVHGQPDFAAFLASFGRSRLEGQQARAAELTAR